jgi:lipid-A-disaccharide synthase-like uncharacterized protein
MSASPWIEEWFRSPARWTAIGCAGQFLFGPRFAVRWFVSEGRRHVVIPGAFWSSGPSGGAALFLAAVHEQDPVFALGRGLGMLIHARNLALLRRGRPA